MENPNNLENVFQAFDNMTFQVGLKVSFQEKCSALKKSLRDKAACAKRLFVEKNDAFGAIEDEDIACACVDESVVKRTEFSVVCRSNRVLALVGDAFLRLHLATHCFRENTTPQQYQNRTNVATSNKFLATRYDALLGEEDVCLRWVASPQDARPTDNQKAAFLEAMIGMLVLTERTHLATWLCEQLQND